MTDRERFESLIGVVLAHEGGYVNDPNDPGGETKYGISKRCLSPKTRVLTADLRWVQCENLSVGDKLLAFDENPERRGKLNIRRLKVAEVLDIGLVCLPASRITTENTSLIASDDHQWLIRRGAHRVHFWARTVDILKPIGKYGHKHTEVWISRFIHPWDRIDSRAAGYIAGILDGEGHVWKGGGIGFSQKQNACLAQAEAAMRELRIDFERCNLRHGVWTIKFKNGRTRPYFSVEIAGMLGAERLLAKLADQLVGKNVVSTCSFPDRVLSVESVGEQKLIGIETNTHTLIAEGLLSHNSYPKLDIKNLTVDQASDIYYRDWWLRLRLNEVRDDHIAQKILDTCVNVGARTGVKLLQRALSAVGQKVAVDGLMGPQTIDAVNHVDPQMLLAAMRCQQAAYYRHLIERNPKLARFERGWMNRAYS